MLKRKYMILGFLAFCLTATLFVGVTTSGTSPSTTQLPEYDPWCDLNDDGRITITDIVIVALRFGATGGTPIDKAAIAYNSTVVYKETLLTTPIVWVDMEDTKVTITLTRPSDLLIMFSSEARTNYTQGKIWLGARVDGDPAKPYPIYFTPRVEAAPTDWHSHTLDYSAYAFNFLYHNASTGTHTVKIQWFVSLATTGMVWYRTLAVMAVNQ